MRRTCVIAAVLAALAGCDSKTPTAPTRTVTEPPPQPEPQVAEVTVSGDGRFTALNQVRSFTAAAQMTDGSLRDVTAKADWRSSDPAVVTISSSGAVTSVGIGLATISANYSRRGTAEVTVAPDDPSGISGVYRLDFTAAAACFGLPDWARHRAYDAIIQQSEESSNGTTGFLLTVQLEPGTAPRFGGSIKGSRVGLWFPTVDGASYYYYGDPVFYHRIDDNHTYTVKGDASATKGGSHFARIAGTLNGFIRAVDPLTGEAIAECHSAQHQFTLERR